MPALVGRTSEQRTLAAALSSKSPELIAIYGRRRVGKTFLVREFFGEKVCFELSGLHGASLAVQLKNFQLALADALGGGLRPALPEDWLDAFEQLKSYLTRLSKQRRVIFLDELPWLATRRSGFLPAFEHFWNGWASRQDWLVVVVCGSATSWMWQRLLNARGGLHNRVTRRVRVEPFDLATTEAFLLANQVRLTRYQVLELYMALGGIPHYLKEVGRGELAWQAIDRLAFSRDGLLRDEFHNLYASLFEKAERHEKVVRALAARPSGILRTELLATSGLSSGGTTSVVLDDLEQSGFISSTPQYRRKTKESLFRLVDEYSLFYLKWIEGQRGASAWQSRRDSPRWRAWSGLAFESLCLKHVPQIKQALGIAAVTTVESAWSHRVYGGPAGESGAQIDLVIDRADGCTHLCEIKFSESPFVIDKRYASVLRHKQQAFRNATRTKHTLFLTMITTHGIAENSYANELVDNSVTMDALFEQGRA